MNCEYFSKCGSCTLYDKTYQEQLDYKIEIEKERFKDFNIPNIDIIKSDEKKFRNRAEFRIWKLYDENDKPSLHYAMNDMDKKPLPINSCEIVTSPIKELMTPLIETLNSDECLKNRLFACEFLTSTTNDVLLTLIYHRTLDESWEEKAKALAKQFNIKIIGRSRKQKLVLSEDFIEESLSIDSQTYHFNYKEGGFTQPNTLVNAKMIEWVINNLEKSNKDLCELYCGGGNFTIPLSKHFNQVLATEISKTSINSAKQNCKLNNISNIEFIRMSSQEFVEALNEKREFRRLKDVNLKAYDFSSIFMDPPRAGLDDTTRALAKEFDNIIYISCNPQTLHRDLQELCKTHTIVNMGFFDQFAYTKHIESGVILKRK